ncbi:MAG TPA: DNA polymerase III subunit gamma/tau [Candidatus Paceibacterota bacterium]
MASTSLYRKYRPEKFRDVIGQSQVISVLENAIKTGNISHAYLFEGSRGTGKTSVARILAKLIGTGPTDLYEIDAASNRGIDEVRELREAVRTLPFESKYKVYIIDEVHMLTTPAFNALLKTLEEPPPHVIFILATTEAHKLPETIISRCQTHKFMKPTEEDLKQDLSRVIKSEGYKSDKGSLELIALLAEGSYRDALTILEKILAISSNKVIEVSEVEVVTGAPKSELVETFLTAILAGNAGEALTILAKARENNLDMKVFTKLVLRSAREYMFAALAPELATTKRRELSPEHIKKIPNILRAFLSAYNDISYAYIPSLPLELAVIDLCQ